MELPGVQSHGPLKMTWDFVTVDALAHMGVSIIQGPGYNPNQQGSCFTDTHKKGTVYVTMSLRSLVLSKAWGGDMSRQSLTSTNRTLSLSKPFALPHIETAKYATAGSSRPKGPMRRPHTASRSLKDVALESLSYKHEEVVLLRAYFVCTWVAVKIRVPFWVP